MPEPRFVPDVFADRSGNEGRTPRGYWIFEQTPEEIAAGLEAARPQEIMTHA